MVLQAPGTFNSKAIHLESTNSGYLEKHSPWDSEPAAQVRGAGPLAHLLSKCHSPQQSSTHGETESTGNGWGTAGNKHAKSPQSPHQRRSYFIVMAKMTLK